MAYEAVIGLECHMQLNTATKMFCGCPAEFGAEPNSNVCPVCLGLPGALPSTNRAAIDSALRLGLALGCDIRCISVFARKNYFYPDMPKNYQISQYDQPLCENGAVPVIVDGVSRTFELTRIHAEEDTGKSFHPERYGDRRVSRVDFNRAGVPLLELVTRPVFSAPGECGAFLGELRRLVRWLGISDADMEKGHLRCDANVSLRPVGTSALGTKTELKNLNSIKGVEKGITAEIERQRALLERGERIEQATLLYDADHDKLAVMRTKEHAHDYRYFPEPDLPVLVVSEAWIANARERVPELPWARERRLIADYGLRIESARVLCDDKDRADRFEDLVKSGRSADLASNWIINIELAHLNKLNLSYQKLNGMISFDLVTTLLGRIESANVTATAGKIMFDKALAGADAGTLFVSGGAAVSSADDLRPLVAEVMAAHPDVVRQYLAGKTATLGFLVGQVMKRSGGQAVPQVVQDLLREVLEERARTS